MVEISLMVVILPRAGEWWLVTATISGPKGRVYEILRQTGGGWGGHAPTYFA